MVACVSSNIGICQPGKRTLTPVDEKPFDPTWEISHNKPRVHNSQRNSGTVIQTQDNRRYIPRPRTRRFFPIAKGAQSPSALTTPTHQRSTRFTWLNSKNGDKFQYKIGSSYAFTQAQLQSWRHFET